MSMPLIPSPIGTACRCHDAPPMPQVLPAAWVIGLFRLLYGFRANTVAVHKGYDVIHAVSHASFAELAIGDAPAVKALFLQRRNTYARDAGNLRLFEPSDILYCIHVSTLCFGLFMAFEKPVAFAVPVDIIARCGVARCCQPCYDGRQGLTHAQKRTYVSFIIIFASSAEQMGETLCKKSAY